MPKFFSTLASWKTRTWLGAVALITVAERALLYVFYRPVAYSDTANYRHLAEAVLGGWGRYDGTRTPGYPVFMALMGPDEHVYLAQLVLGLLTTLLFFYLGWRVSGKGWFGALAALAHSLNAQQLLFEANLISESLTTFLVAASLAGTAWLLVPQGRRPGAQILAVAGAVGLAGGMAALTRPLFIFLPFLAALFLVLFWRAGGTVRWGAALTVGLTATVIIAVWVNFLHEHFHLWGMDTMTGYHLVQHTGIFFEYVPDEYAVIRDTYIKFRDARLAETGAPTNAIWDAIPAIEKASGVGFYDLSDLLTKISFHLILNHPLLYLRGVAQGWLWFWKAPVYWAAEQIDNPAFRLISSGLILAERGGIFFANLIFLAGSLSLAWKKARRALKMDLWLYFAVATLWLTSLFQTLLDHGDNPRFSVPVQSLLILVALWWGIQVIRTLIHPKGKNGKEDTLA